MHEYGIPRIHQYARAKVTYWNLDHGLRSVRNDNLADVLSGTQKADSGRDVRKGELMDGCNGIYVACLDHLE